jgi:hypothetical protein
MPKGTGGFAKTGKARPGQWSPRVKGQTETNFKQKSAAQTTAAMQGGPAPSGKATNRWIRPARNDASKQFGNPPGKKVF